MKQNEINKGMPRRHRRTAFMGSIHFLSLDFGVRTIDAFSLVIICTPQTPTSTHQTPPHHTTAPLFWRKLNTLIHNTFPILLSNRISIQAALIPGTILSIQIDMMLLLHKKHFVHCSGQFCPVFKGVLLYQC